MSNSPVYLVVLGANFPRYGLSSMQMMVRYSGQSVHLISESHGRKYASKAGAQFTDIKSFYSGHEAEEVFAKLVPPSPHYGGLWRFSLERLFVLEQFMRFSGVESIFHAELDQMLFRSDKLVQALEEIDIRGLCYPFHKSGQGMASVLYCNDLDELARLRDFASRGQVFSSEMELLGRWASFGGNSVVELPTVAHWGATRFHARKSHDSVFKLSPKDLGGLVDAAQVGQWLAGVDPRNLHLSTVPRTKWTDSRDENLLATEELSSLKFDFRNEDNTLLVKNRNGCEYPLYNIHLHSKIHSYLNGRRDRVRIFVYAGNSKESVSLPGVRQAQVVHSLQMFLREIIRRPGEVPRLVLRSLFIILKLRPSSYPFISGDFFRAIAAVVWEGSDSTRWKIPKRPGEVVFCESDRLEQAMFEIGPKIKVPIVLILGNSDRNFGEELFELLPNPLIHRVFAQNLAVEEERFTAIPIGLENPWRVKNGLVTGFVRRPAANKRRILRVMCAFSVETNREVRSVALESLEASNIAEHLGSLTPAAHRESLRRFAFVACPDGNGLDTHRVWEAIYLGCIPIVLRSPMTEAFEKLGLPIWVVDKFADLSTYSESDLEKKRNSILKKFSSEAIWARYWSKQVKFASQSARESMKKPPNALRLRTGSGTPR